MSWTKDDGLIELTAGMLGFTQPLHELVDDIHRRGWTVTKIHVKDGQYVAQGKNPHQEKLEATGRTDATAAANLLVKIMRREHMRGSSVRQKLGAWDHQPIEQQLGAIAQAYAGAPVYQPKAATAWMDLAQDCGRRAMIIRQQVAVEYTDDPVPYENADELREDVTKKRHITITRAYAHHPVWSEQQMLDYRLVVDVLGHTISGGDWGWHGTCLAFAALAPLLADAPQKALFTELLGQAAFGAFYRQWGPQKICFLEELITKEQEKENKPGHTGVHPSQSIVPASMPGIFSSVPSTGADPNATWESGVNPLPDNAYLWQRDENGTDPLNIHDAMESWRPMDVGLSRLHPEMGRQAVVNALRSSLLGTRNNPMGHAMHYQSLMHLPAGVDDPIAYHDALEQQREHWNQARGYAPGAHKQYWPEEQQFKQWVKAANPHLDDGDVARVAKRELLHMLTEEEERIVAQDQGEQLTAEVVQHEAYEAIKRRLKALTKPTVDQKVDFGDDHLFHEAGVPQVMYHVAPADAERNIAAQGLHGDNGDWGDMVWLWDDLPTAQAYAGSGDQIWEVRTNGLDVEPGGNEASEHGGLAWASTTPIPADRLRRVTKIATHHADMYPPYLVSRLRPIAQVSRHAAELSEAARQDLVQHRGAGHHFRSTALGLGIPGLGPRQVSNAWLHLAPQTSQLGVIAPQVDEALGHDYLSDMGNRDYFKHERELAAGRDAAGYNHVPLGAFSSALYDLKAGGPGWHPDRTPFKPYAPAPHAGVDWAAQAPSYPDWGDPYWWASTQQARDQAGQDFDRNVAVNFGRDEVPFQKTANSPALPCPTCGGPLDYLLTRNQNNAYCPTCKTTTGIGLDEPREVVHYREGVIPAGLEGRGLPWGVLPQRQGRTAMQWDDAGNILPVYDLKPGEQRYPWVTHPTTGQRVTGSPGTSLMQHVMTTVGHQDPREVWAQDYEVGKGSGTIAKVAQAEDDILGVLRDQERAPDYPPPHVTAEYGPWRAVWRGGNTAWVYPYDAPSEDRVYSVRQFSVPEPVTEAMLQQRLQRSVAGDEPRLSRTIAKVADWNPSANTVRSWYDPAAVKPFHSLPPEAQSALQRYEEDAAVDAGDWDEEDESGRPQIPADQPFGYSTVPMSDFTTALLGRLRAEGDTWPDWDAYHRDYVSHPDMPDHGDSRWPVLTDPNLVVDDGFHRLHDYYRKGDQSVPIVWSPEQS